MKANRHLIDHLKLDFNWPLCTDLHRGKQELSNGHHALEVLLIACFHKNSAELLDELVRVDLAKLRKVYRIRVRLPINVPVQSSELRMLSRKVIKGLAQPVFSVDEAEVVLQNISHHVRYHYRGSSPQAHL